MVYDAWGVNNTFYISTSVDGLVWSASQVLWVAPPPRAIAYGQIIGRTNSSMVDAATATLVYAGAPPTSGYPRDFIYRNITLVYDDDDDDSSSSSFQ